MLPLGVMPVFIYLIAEKNMDTKEQRSLFESWCIDWNITSIFPLDDDGQYQDYQTHLLYCAWLQGQAR